MGERGGKCSVKKRIIIIKVCMNSRNETFRVGGKAA